MAQWFPEGLTIGIKQPYLKISFGGFAWMRNDNSKNIVLKSGEILGNQINFSTLDSIEFKEKGNMFFKNGDFI